MAEGSITCWLGTLCDDEETASGKLWDRLQRRLLRLARRALADVSRGMCDEEDIALAAFVDFFRGVKVGAFPELANRNDLWRLLVRITYRRAADYQRTQENRLLKSGVWKRHDLDDRVLAASNATTQEAVDLKDWLDTLLKRLDDENLCQVALLKLEGYTNREIARLSGSSLRTVERRIALVRERLLELAGDGSICLSVREPRRYLPLRKTSIVHVPSG
jgi:DNA-directed RNA polymerase specialized sigma24 family protein